MVALVERERWRGPALSLLRIVTALLFVEHGAAKLLGFPPMSPPMTIVAGTLPWFAGMLELVGGLLLLLGLFSRPVAFILSGEMAVAYWMAHAPQSTYPILNGGEGAILFCFIFLYIAAAGPGPWSIDDGLKQRRLTGTRDVADEGMTTLP